jgi:hypothetical protein
VGTTSIIRDFAIPLALIVLIEPLVASSPQIDKFAPDQFSRFQLNNGPNYLLHKTEVSRSSWQRGRERQVLERLYPGIESQPNQMANFPHLYVIFAGRTEMNA